MHTAAESGVPLHVLLCFVFIRRKKCKVFVWLASLALVDRNAYTEWIWCSFFFLEFSYWFWWMQPAVESRASVSGCVPCWNETIWDTYCTRHDCVASVNGRQHNDAYPLDMKHTRARKQDPMANNHNRGRTTERKMLNTYLLNRASKNKINRMKKKKK